MTKYRKMNAYLKALEKRQEERIKECGISAYGNLSIFIRHTTEGTIYSKRLAR